MLKMDRFAQICSPKSMTTLRLRSQSFHVKIIFSLLRKQFGHIIKFIQFMDQNISEGGHQYAKTQNLKFHSFCSTNGINSIFLPDVTLHNKVFCWTKFSGFSSRKTEFITKRPSEIEVSRAWDQVKIKNFTFLFIIMQSIPEGINVPLFLSKSSLPNFKNADFVFLTLGSSQASPSLEPSQRTPPKVQISTTLELFRAMTFNFCQALSD